MIKASNQWGTEWELLSIELSNDFFVAAGYSLLAFYYQQEYKSVF
jgi:hypothetical protein